MSSLPIAPQLQQIVADLKTSATFADLPEEDLAWLAERMEERRMNPGDVIAQEGDPLEYLIVMLEGEMHVERPDEPGMPLFIARAPKVTGLLPFSRSTKYMGTARIVRPLRSLLLHKDTSRKCCIGCRCSANAWLDLCPTASAKPPAKRRSATN